MLKPVPAIIFSIRTTVPMTSKLLTTSLLISFALTACSNAARERLVADTEGKTNADSKLPASPAAQMSTISGIIGDSMCGASHQGMLQSGSMGTNDASCTIKCVEAGSKFVLVDSSGQVYLLLDQQKARKFAGRKVKITGVLDKSLKRIQVKEIQSAGPD